MNRVAATIGLLVLTSLPAHAVTLSETEWNAPSLATFAYPFPRTATTFSVDSRGNPGTAFSVNSSVTALARSTASVFAIVGVESLSYDPTMGGAVDKLSWSLDYRFNASTRPIERGGVGLTLLQSSKLFLSVAQSVGNAGGWETLGRTALGADDFVELDLLSFQTIAGSHPDFGGPVMAFGVTVAGTLRNQGNGSSSVAFSHSVDNLQVVLSPVPEPATAALVVWGLAFLAVRRRTVVCR